MNETASLSGGLTAGSMISLRSVNAPTSVSWHDICHFCHQLMMSAGETSHIRISQSSQSTSGTNDNSSRSLIIDYNGLPPRTPSISIPMEIQCLAHISHDLARYDHGPTVPFQYSLHLHLDAIAKDPSKPVDGRRNTRHITTPETKTS